MNYRTESFIDYLNLHKSDIILNIKKNLNLIVFSVLIFLGIAFSSMSPKLIVINFLMITSFFLLGFGVVFYLFPMTIHYKIFSRSSKQYSAINKYILKRNFNVLVQTENSEISIRNKFKFYGESISEIINYNFERADVFETKYSIFIFPISKRSNKKSNILITTYLPPLRFMKEEEQISGIFDMYTIPKFNIKYEKDKLLLEFQDNKYKNNH